MPSTVASPVLVQNPLPYDYHGTVLCAVPLPQGLVFSEALNLKARDSVTGVTFDCAYVIAAEYPDGSARWINVQISGVFPANPNADQLIHVYSEEGGAQAPYFIPKRYNVLAETEHVIQYLDAGGAVNEKRISLAGTAGLPGSQYHVAHSNDCLLDLVREDRVAGDLWIVTYVRFLKGEDGPRFKVLLENRGAALHPRIDLVHREYIVRAVLRSKLQADRPANAAITLSFPGGRNTQAPAQLEHVTVRWGSARGPLRFDVVGENIEVTWLSSAGAVPEGGPFAGPVWLRPGTPLPPKTGNAYTDWDPRSKLGQAIKGGEKLQVEGFLGFGLRQEFVDVPVMARLANIKDYAPFIVGGLTPRPSVDSAVAPHRTRLEKLFGCLVDRSLGDNLPSLPAKTVADFINNGGTYAVAAPLNPLFGVRDHGDLAWADGYPGANHYDIASSFWWNWLRTGDRRWLDLAMPASQHLQSVDFVWGHGKTGVCYDSFGYEKGLSSHGAAQEPTATHVWCEALIWNWLWTLDYESYSCLAAFSGNLRAYHTLVGTPVSSSFIAAGGKPENYGAASAYDPAHPPAIGSATGWQGDWGVRYPGRVLENAVKLHHMMGLDHKNYIEAVLSNVLRVEGGIWGGHGYILNRGERANGYEDNEQPWMLFYATRGVGYAIEYGVTSEPAFAALYGRMLAVCASLQMRTNANPGFEPTRPFPVLTKLGGGNIVRFGIGNGTLSKFNTWKNGLASGTRSQHEAAWLSFYKQYQALDCAKLVAGQVYRYPAWVRFNDAAIAVATAYTDGGEAPAAVVQAMVNEMPNVTMVKRDVGILYSSLLSDLLAQASKLGYTQYRDMALDNALSWLYHHQDGGAINSYATPEANPSACSFRMMAYPGSETKIWGALLDTRHAAALLEEVAPTSVPYYPLITLNVSAEGFILGEVAATPEQPADADPTLDQL